MAETSDDPIARVGSLRKRGRIGAAELALAPAHEIDRRGRHPRPRGFRRPRKTCGSG